jgi:NAD(P)-dependent dehydrogenase (short-subunit alcohol dehydrogenase family)
MPKKVAIVTGASGNLGQAVVQKFLSEKFIVIGTVIPNDPVKLEINDTNFEKVVVDLTSEPDTEGFIKDIIAKHGVIDAAILTVGGFAMSGLENTRLSDVKKQITLNFETAFNTAKPVFLQMKKQGNGRIFLIGSRPGLDSKNGKGMIAYSLSKSLVFRLAEMMNDEAKGTNVVASVIVPSTIDTPENRKSMPGSDPGKWVKASEIANTIHYYCTEKASTIREPVIKLYNNS